MKELIRAFKALSDPTRLRIYLLLMKRDLCVCELMFILDMPQSRVSHQLRLLRDADLVEDKREGRWIIYAVPPSVKESLAPLLRQLAGPDLSESPGILEDVKRLELCVRENIRKKPEADSPQTSV
jgi:ArsR family transcriptional regulator